MNGFIKSLNSYNSVSSVYRIKLESRHEQFVSAYSATGVLHDQCTICITEIWKDCAHMILEFACSGFHIYMDLKDYVHIIWMHNIHSFKSGECCFISLRRVFISPAYFTSCLKWIEKYHTSLLTFLTKLGLYTLKHQKLGIRKMRVL